MSKTPAEEITRDRSHSSSAHAESSDHRPSPGVGRRVGVRELLAGLALRGGILYTVLFVVARCAGLIPGLGGVAGYYYRLKVNVVAWVGQHVLRLDQPVGHFSTGSGDEVFDWVLVFTLLALALIGAVGWLILDRSRRYEGVAVEAVRIVIRYRLGVTMLGYGMEKVLRTQMLAPDLAKLLQPYGESSPMGLLWTFMGHSWVYSAFTGAVEVMGGVLLLFRRTTTLGALVVGAVMMNVLMLNVGYDVPVKLYSTHYLVFAVVLAAPDLRRLMTFFFSTRPVPGAAPAPAWLAPRGVLVVKLLVIGVILWQIPLKRTWRWAQWPEPPTIEFAGLYEVETFTRDGQERPPLTTDPIRWRRVAFDAQGVVTVVLMNDARTEYVVVPGLQEGQFTLASRDENSARRDEFSYIRHGSDVLTLTGTLDRSGVVIGLRRSPEEKLLLRERGFHWVSESAFKR